MKKVIISVVMHVIAVAVPAALAYAAWNLLGSESEYVLVGIAMAFVAAEKLIRAMPAFPVADWVNEV